MSDQELWQQLQSGQKSALETMYRSHADALLRYGYKFSSDEQLVEDCVQDLFIELWKNRENLGANDSIRPYLFVAIRRKIIRQFGKRSKLKASSEEPDYTFEVEFGVENTIIAEEIAQERQSELEAALQSLSKREKEAIYLKYQMGLEYEEICTVMEISYQSARNLIARGLKNLKELLTAVKVVWWVVFFWW